MMTPLRRDPRQHLRKIKLLGRILAESDQIAAFERSNKVALSPRSVKKPRRLLAAALYDA